MRVFIRSIPESTTGRDIRQFVLGAVCSRFHRFLRRKNRITSIEIMQLADQRGRAVEYHAVVEFERVDIALMAIKKLNGSHLKGSPVEVRCFYARSSYRDRRRQRSEVPVLAIHDRRMGGRRRLNLKSSPVTVAGPRQPSEMGANYTMEAVGVQLY